MDLGPIWLKLYHFPGLFGLILTDIWVYAIIILNLLGYLWVSYRENKDNPTSRTS